MRRNGEKPERRGAPGKHKESGRAKRKVEKRKVEKRKVMKRKMEKRNTVTGWIQGWISERKETARR